MNTHKKKKRENFSGNLGEHLQNSFCKINFKIK